MVTRRPTVVRGNASEILSLAGHSANTKGVDSTDPVERALAAAQAERARQGAPKQEFVQASIIDTTPGAVTIPTDYSQDLVDALRQPYTIAIDETAVTKLGVKLGDKALYNGQTVTVVGITRGGLVSFGVKPETRYGAHF